MQTTKPTIGGLEVEVCKDFYLGLWNIKYISGGKFAGPYKTKREANDRLLSFVDVAQAVEPARTVATLPAPCGTVRIIGKILPAPDNRANRATAHRRRAMATAERHEREALAVQERIDRVVAAGRAS